MITTYQSSQAVKRKNKCQQNVIVAADDDDGDDDGQLGQASDTIHVDAAAAARCARRGGQGGRHAPSPLHAIILQK